MVILLSYIFVYKKKSPFQSKAMQLGWCFCHVSHGSRGWPDCNSEGIKKRQADTWRPEKLASGELGFLMEKL